jgi:hypothetical protein
VSAEVSPAAQSAGGHGSLVEAAHDHNSLAEGIPPQTCRRGAVLVAGVSCRSADSWSRVGHHISSLGTRRAEVCCRTSTGDARHNGRRGGSRGAGREGRGAGWESLEPVCCSLDARSWCVEDARPPVVVDHKTSFAPPTTDTSVHSFLTRTVEAHTCSGSACIGSLSGLNPLLYAMVGKRCEVASRRVPRLIYACDRRQSVRLEKHLNEATVSEQAVIDLPSPSPSRRRTIAAQPAARLRLIALAKDAQRGARLAYDAGEPGEHSSSFDHGDTVIGARVGIVYGSDPFHLLY